MERVLRATPFTVDISDEALADLKARLRATRLADDFANEDGRYGLPRNWLAPMLDHWANHFDWRAQESAMNRHAQYRCAIGGVPVHFLHIPGKGPNPTPLLLTHGWPWTFWDWHAMIDPLSDPAAHGGDPADAFDLIIPSLPGFGFSSPLRQTGLNVRAIGNLWVKLMTEILGYPRFFAAGGDWGSMITAELGHAHPQHLLGVHLSLPLLPGLDVRTLDANRYAPDEHWMPTRNAAARAITTSHVAVHGHDPQTLAYALNDSPAGLAAWIWERRLAWSAATSDAARDPDFLCATASLYWFTRSIGTSMRLYAEHRAAPWRPIDDRMLQIPVPTAFAVAPEELILLPRAIAEKRTNLARWSVLPRGGHFLPAEEPEHLADEYRAFVRPLRSG